MGIPAFMRDEKAKPVGPYEWSLWLLINALVVVSFVIIIVPMVVIAALMLIVDAITGGEE